MLARAEAKVQRGRMYIEGAEIVHYSISSKQHKEGPEGMQEALYEMLFRKK